MCPHMCGGAGQLRNPALGIRTHNRVARLMIAKEQFKSIWIRCVRRVSRKSIN